MARTVNRRAGLLAALWMAALMPSGACRQPAEPTTGAREPVAADPAPAPEPAPGPSSPEAASVDGVRLELHGCELALERAGRERERRALPMPGDCQFAKAGDAVQIETTQRGKTLLVVSSRPLPGRPGDCDTRVRALVVTPDAVLVSGDEQTIRMCGAEGPFDSPMFHVLAASVETSR